MTAPLTREQRAALQQIERVRRELEDGFIDFAEFSFAVVEILDRAKGAK